MSSGKTIDGLQRRKSPSKPSVSPKKRKSSSNSSSKKQIPVKSVSRKKTTTTKLNIEDAFDKQLESKKVSNTKRKIKEADETTSSAVKDFLTENYNEDMDDLIDIPKKQKSKKDKKPKEKKKRKTLKRVLITLALILVVAGGGIYLYLNDFVSQITDGGNIIGLLLSDPDTPLEKDEYGRSNILVFGTEGWVMDNPNYDGGFLTDSMIVLSINQDTGDIKAVSLPRDLKTTTCTSTGKLNETYWCDYMDYLNQVEAGKKFSEGEIREFEKKAANALAQKFEETLGVKVQYRVHVNWEAVVRIVDAIGGVDVVFTYGDQKWDGEEVAIKTTDERGIADLSYDYVNYNFEYENGKVIHLDGSHALMVARARNAFGGYGASGGNFSREYFQQRIIEAMVKKARKINITSDLVKALKIKDAIGNNLRTNFKDTEIKTLLKLADTDVLSKIDTISLYSDETNGSQGFLTTGMIDGISYVYPIAGIGQYQDIHDFIKKQFSGHEYMTENARIVVLNGSGVDGAAKNEKNDLEDDGFIVNQTANAPKEKGLTDFEGVKVYQFNKDKQKTAKALKKRYNVDLKTKIPDALKQYDCDFVVILGK